MNYKEIVKKQRDYFEVNKTFDISHRLENLKKLKSLIKRNEPELYKAVYADFKKSEFETYTTELGLLYKELDIAIKHLKHWVKPRRVKTNLANFPARSFQYPSPLGVCLIIGAWNYPYLLSLSPLVSAIAAGNTVILKPGEIAPATSAIMERLINTHFPAELLFVIEGGEEETTILLKEKFDKIFFTGSTEVGKIVYQAAAKHLTPVTLELGGKCPAIVTRSSLLNITARRLVWAKFLNAGQTCIAPDYIVVDEAVKEEFIKYLVYWVERFDYALTNNNYVQIVNDRNFNRLISLIDKSKVYYGGQWDAETRYIAPTILTGIQFSDTIMEEEIFGPILPVISYVDFDEAINKIKLFPKPLASYVFTKDKEEREKFLTRLPSGGGVINDVLLHISNPDLPFGGLGESGIGSYHGEAGFKTFTHYKSMLDKPFWPDIKLRYPPNTYSKLKWIRRLLNL